MSKKKTENKIVQIKEGALVDLIDNIVKKAVDSEKKTWLAENESKAEKVLKETVAKVAKLEKLFSGAKVTKKVVKKTAAKK